MQKYGNALINTIGLQLYLNFFMIVALFEIKLYFMGGLFNQELAIVTLSQ